MTRTDLAVAIVVMLHGVNLAPRAVSAQDGFTGVPVGTRVRLTLPDSLRAMPLGPRATGLVGYLARTSGDTLFVLPPGAVVPTAVIRSALRGMERSRGASPMRSALQQGLIGGLAWGLVTYTLQRGEVNRTRHALAWGAGGFGLGAVLGGVRPYEQWQRVPLLAPR